MHAVRNMRNRIPVRPHYAAAGIGALAMLWLGCAPVVAQAPATGSYACAADAHCTVSCTVDGDKVLQTGGPKTVSVTMLAHNNYLVELLEQNGQIHYAYLAGTKVVCMLDGVTRKGS